MATIPGLRFFHQGQFEGRKDHLPVQLGRWREEPPTRELCGFYERLLAAANDDLLHAGEWSLLDVLSAGDSSNDDLVAWRWAADGDLRVVAANLGGRTAHGLVQLGSTLPGDPAGDIFIFEDVLTHREYSWTRTALARGLYVKLESGAAHIFRVIPQA
jgi:hypothetical protein